VRIDLNNLAGGLSGVEAAGSGASLGDPGLASAGSGAVLGTGNLSAGASGGPAGADFGEMLDSLVGRVNQSQHDADAMVESLALGEPVDVHQVMMALSEASNAMQLTLQVRNKALEAYQELMRTPV
jgi:flagellar hook-basal body complex protein FliE